MREYPRSRVWDCARQLQNEKDVAQSEELALQLLPNVEKKALTNEATSQMSGRQSVSSSLAFRFMKVRQILIFKDFFLIPDSRGDASHIKLLTILIEFSPMPLQPTAEMLHLQDTSTRDKTRWLSRGCEAGTNCCYRHPRRILFVAKVFWRELQVKGRDLSRVLWNVSQNRQNVNQRMGMVLCHHHNPGLKWCLWTSE